MTAIGKYQYIYLSNVVEHSLNSNKDAPHLWTVSYVQKKPKLT